MPIHAQFISFGVKGGIVPTPSLDADPSYHNEDRNYTVGPSIEVKIPMTGFSIETDALYRRIGYSTFSTDIVGDTYSARQRGYSWETPILLKRYFGPSASPVKLFLSGGYAGRSRNWTSGTGTSMLATDLAGNYTTTTSTLKNTSNWDNGYAVAAGAQMNLGLLKGSVEYRFSHYYGLDRQDLSHGGYFGYNPNQSEVLVGFRF